MVLLVVWSAVVYRAVFDLTLAYTIDIGGKLMPINKWGTQCDFVDVCACPTSTDASLSSFVKQCPADAKCKDSRNRTCHGGVARQATSLKKIRAENPNLLLLDTGFSFFGSLFFKVWRANASRWFFEYLDYDAVAINHGDFHGGAAALGEFVHGLKIPAVITNANTSTEPLIGDGIVPWTVKKIGGRSIAVLNIIRPDLQMVTNGAGNVIVNPHCTMATMVEIALSQIKQQHPDCNIIIAIAEDWMTDWLYRFSRDLDVIITRQGMGYDFAEGNTLLQCVGNDDRKSYDQQEQARFALQNGTNLFGQKVVRLPAQPQDRRGIERIDIATLRFDDTGGLISTDFERRRIGSEVLMDTHAWNQTLKFLQGIDSLKQVQISETKTYLYGLSGREGDGDGTKVDMLYVSTIRPGGCRFGDCTMGRLVTGAMLHACSTCDIALINAGAIRGSFSPGPIYLGDVYKVLPFENMMTTVLVKGRVIRLALEHAAHEGQSEGGFLQAGGLRFAWDGKDTVHAIQVFDRSEQRFMPLYEDQSYMLAVNDYIYTGGDHYDMFKPTAGQIEEGAEVITVEDVRVHVENGNSFAALVVDFITNRTLDMPTYEDLSACHVRDEVNFTDTTDRQTYGYCRIVLVPPRMNKTKPYVQPASIKIAGLFALSEVPEVGRLSAARLAAEEINADRSLLAGTFLDLKVLDSQSSFETSVELLDNEPNITAILGPSSSADMSMDVAKRIKVDKTPIVGFSTTSSRFSSTCGSSEDLDFFYYFRTCPSDADQASAIVDIFKHFCLCCAEAQLQYDNPSSSDADRKALADMVVEKASRKSVTMTISNAAVPVKTNMLVLTISNAMEVRMTVAGETISIRQQEPRGQYLKRRKHIENVLGTSVLRNNAFAFYAYDAMYTVARAADKLIRSRTFISGDGLRSAIKNLTFDGTTNKIRFDENGDVNSIIYDVLVQQDDGTQKIIGAWSEDLGLILDSEWNAADAAKMDVCEKPEKQDYIAIFVPLAILFIFYEGCLHFLRKNAKMVAEDGRRFASLNFEGRLSKSQTFFIASFPGKYEHRWNKMVGKDGGVASEADDQKISTSCVFYPPESAFSGEHIRGDKFKTQCWPVESERKEWSYKAPPADVCHCSWLYNFKAGWGCAWMERWIAGTRMALSMGLVPVVVYFVKLEIRKTGNGVLDGKVCELLDEKDARACQVEVLLSENEMGALRETGYGIVADEPVTTQTLTLANRTNVPNTQKAIDKILGMAKPIAKTLNNSPRKLLGLTIQTEVSDGKSEMNKYADKVKELSKAQLEEHLVQLHGTKNADDLYDLKRDLSEKLLDIKKVQHAKKLKERYENLRILRNRSEPTKNEAPVALAAIESAMATASYPMQDGVDPVVNTTDTNNLGYLVTVKVKKENLFATESLNPKKNLSLNKEVHGERPKILGGSQEGEVQWLKDNGIDYVSWDILDFCDHAEAIAAAAPERNSDSAKRNRWTCSRFAKRFAGCGVTTEVSTKDAPNYKETIYGKHADVLDELQKLATKDLKNKSRHWGSAWSSESNLSVRNLRIPRSPVTHMMQQMQGISSRSLTTTNTNKSQLPRRHHG